MSDLAGQGLRVAILGSGFMGQVHARAARVNGATVTAIASSTPDRARAAADGFGNVDIIGSAEELAARDDIDVVHVCTPNHLHTAYALAALATNKHVVCEKPLATTTAEATTLAAEARTRRLVAAIPFVYRYYPAVRRARGLVELGELGRPHLIHGSYLQDWMSRPEDWNWRVDPSTGGRSRAMADIGSHWCDLAEFVTGHRITRVMARLGIVHGQRLHTSADGGLRDVETEDSAVVVFETAQGAVGSVVVSQVSPGRKNRLWIEVDGGRRAVSFDQEHPAPLWVGELEDETAPVSGKADRHGYSMLPPGHPQGYNDCFTLFVRDTYRAIRGEAPEGLPNFDDGVRSLRIVEAVLASAQAGEWVEVGS
jgi:predicted dehydrogenase